MYAINSRREVYHLLTPALDYTLCGLNVVPIVIDRPANTSSLYLTSNQPRDREVCKDCQSQSRETISKGK